MIISNIARSMASKKCNSGEFAWRRIWFIKWHPRASAIGATHQVFDAECIYLDRNGRYYKHLETLAN